MRCDELGNVHSVAQNALQEIDEYMINMIKLLQRSYAGEAPVDLQYVASPAATERLAWRPEPERSLAPATPQPARPKPASVKVARGSRGNATAGAIVRGGDTEDHLAAEDTVMVLRTPLELASRHRPLNTTTGGDRSSIQLPDARDDLAAQLHGSLAVNPGMPETSFHFAKRKQRSLCKGKCSCT